MCKVSVIVPIYNAERYLSRSIPSIQRQTLEDIEIILVNDGSTDGSLEICQSYAHLDSRIKIIDQKNMGVSCARNKGLEIAKGEYIGFVDPDDWIDIDMYNNMYIKAERTQSLVAMCNYTIERNDKEISKMINVEKDVFERDEIIEYFILNMLGGDTLANQSNVIMGSVWRLIVKRELILEHNLKFPPNIPVMEDLIFCVSTLVKCPRLCLDMKAHYHYVINNNSAITGYKNNFFKTNNKVFTILTKILEENNIRNITDVRMNTRYIDMIYGCIVNETHRNNPKNPKEIIKYIKELCSKKELLQRLREASLEGLPLKRKLIYLSMRYNKVLALYAYYRFKSKKI